jgi:hypothetical protein
MNTILRNALLLGLAAMSTQAIAASGYKYLSVNLVQQEHSNWCWSGSSVSVLNWYGQRPSQCAVANWALGINYACGNTNFNWNSTANQPNGMYGGGGTIQGILSHWGVNSYGGNYYLYWASVVTEINASRPFVMRYGWTGGGGHFIVGYGFQDTTGTQRIAYMNPWPGEGYTWVNYAWAVSASDHNWTHTLRMN